MDLNSGATLSSTPYSCYYLMMYAVLGLIWAYVKLRFMTPLPQNYTISIINNVLRSWKDAACHVMIIAGVTIHCFSRWRICGACKSGHTCAICVLSHGKITCCESDWCARNWNYCVSKFQKSLLAH